MARAQGGASPNTAQPITVGGCSSAMAFGSASSTDPGYPVAQVNAAYYEGLNGPIHDWYSFSLNRPDNVKIELTRSNPAAQLDFFLFAPISRPNQHPEGIVCIDNHSTKYTSTPAIGPRRLEAAQYVIGVRAHIALSNYTLTITRGIMPSEQLFADHRIAWKSIPAGGFMFINRLTPSRYPATLDKITLVLKSPDGKTDPSGQQLTILVYADPAGTGRLPVGAAPLFVSTRSLPVANYLTKHQSVELSPVGVQISSGDLYAGFLAPNHNGIGLLFDTDGLPINGSFVSRDNGATFSPVTLTDFTGAPTPVANAFIRATVTLPPCIP
ncbi:MAG: hypothetical protein HY650_06700 [Acidobacteria bacterium]|nr:hypothetical protein [Acidobacteriota bacterium]